MIRCDEDREEELLPEEEYLDSVPRPGKGSWVPVLQAVACALILTALAVLKFSQPERFEQITDWYKAEADRVIQLPGFEQRGEESPSQAESLPPTESLPLTIQPSVSPAPMEGVQRV